MRAIIQRVKQASVLVDGQTVGKCGQGLMVLLGVATDDTSFEADMLEKKIVSLRIFSDENGKMNRSLIDVGGELLVVSQFTLFANYRNGNRPDYMGSAKPDVAIPLYEYFLQKCAEDVPTQHGIFGADMQVSLINDGPVTIAMDTDVLKMPKGGKNV